MRKSLSEIKKMTAGIGYCVDKKSERIVIAVFDNTDQDALDRLAAEIEKAIQNDFGNTDMPSHFPDIALEPYKSGVTLIDGQDYEEGPMRYSFPHYLSLYTDGDVHGDRPNIPEIAA